MSIATLYAPQPQYHLTPTATEWEQANHDVEVGSVAQFAVTVPTTGEEVTILATETFLDQWGRNTRSREQWARIFEVAPLLRTPPQSIAPTRYSAEPLGAWIGSVAEEMTITWRLDAATGEPILLTLTC